MHNPFSNVATLLVGASPDYNPLGASRYLYVIFYIALLLGSAAIARRNLQIDPPQRTSRNVWIWLMRVLAAGIQRGPTPGIPQLDDRDSCAEGLLF